MRRYLYALLGMSLLVSISGCVTTGVGGGPNVTAGTYSYLRESWKSSTVSLWQTSGPGRSPLLKATITH